MGLEHIENAIVGEYAIIQPGQAFVDYYFSVGDDPLRTAFGSLGITTTVDPFSAWLAAIVKAKFARDAAVIVDFSGNYMDGASINTAIDGCQAADNNGVNSGTRVLDVSGSGMGDAIDTTKLDALVASGWTVATNIQTITNAQKLALVAPVTNKVVLLSDAFVMTADPNFISASGLYVVNGTLNGKEKYTPVIDVASGGDIFWSGSKWDDSNGHFSTDNTTHFWQATDTGSSHAGYTFVYPARQWFDGGDPSIEANWHTQ